MPVERAEVEQVGGRSRKRRSRWFTGKFLVLSLAVATLLGAAILVVPQLQDKASAANGDRHFILIATHGAPRWSADAQLYDGQGNKVYEWHQSTRSAGRAIWYFTDGGDGGKVDVHIDKGGLGDLNTRHLALDRDHCFLVDVVSDTPDYKGDSKTGGCTSD
jgi:hypothetical protein